MPLQLRRFSSRPLRAVRCLCHAIALFGWLAHAPANDAPAPTTPFSAQTGRPTVSIGHSQTISEAVISPDGKKLFTMDYPSLRAWDMESARELGLLKALGYGVNTWNPTFSAKRKWMLIPLRGSVTVFNYETLDELPAIEGMHSPAAIYWDDTRDRGYVVDVRGRENNRFAIGEIIPKGPGTEDAEVVFHTIVTMTAPSGVGSFCRSIFPLDDKRLFIDTTFGYFVIDRETWKVSRPDVSATPTGDDERVSLLEQKLLRVSLPLVYEGKEYSPGPENTVIGKNWITPSGSHHVLEILAAKDLSVLRSTAIAELGSVSFTDPTAFDAKARVFWLRTGRELLAFDFDTLARRETHAVEGIDFSKPVMGRYLSVARRLPESGEWLLVSGQTIWRYNAATKKTVATFGDGIAPVSRIVTSPHGFEFFLAGPALKSKRVRILPNGLDVSTIEFAVGGAAYDPAGESLTLGNATAGYAEIFDLTSWPKPDYRVPQNTALAGPTGRNLVYSSDGTVLVMHSEHGVGAIDMTSGKTLLDEKLSRTAIGRAPDIVAISPDKRWVIAFDGERKIVGFDLTRPDGQRRVWEQALSGYPANFTVLGPRTFLCSHGGEIEYRDITTGALLMSVDLPDKTLVGRSNPISPDKKLTAVCDKEISVYEVETGRRVWHIETDTHINSAAFFANSRHLITVSVDNLIRIWDVQEKRELCTITLFENNNEWVVSSGDLRFDASEKAIDKMYVVKGTSVIPLESLFEKLYTPQLLATLLKGEKLEAPAVDLKKLASPPVVKLELADGSRNLVVEDDTNSNDREIDAVRLRALADARQSTVAEIRLFQNGKLLSSAQGRGTQFAESFNARLIPGENVFRAIAYNADRTESRPSEVTITYRPKEPSTTDMNATGASAPPAAGLKLHLLVVGVNTYKNPKYNLNYAVADATAVKEKIEAQTRSIFTGVNVKFIVNAQAQKSAIIDAFHELTAKAGPRDVFVFYYAGHGVMTADAKPEFYLVPHDVTQLYGADDALRQKGISSAELLELSKQMPAQKQLFILDACQSAGALTTVAMRGAAEEKAIAQLARSSGTHWLTASGSQQFATEFEQLGHGAFTYALIEGLAGKADTGDGRVTVNELKAFLESEVPEITQKHKGTPQFPSSYGFGQDFPVVVIAK